MKWYEIYDGVFFITILTILTGSIALGFKYCLKSKCQDFSCCYGLIVIKRDISAEVEEELKEMELNANRSDVFNNEDI